MAGRSFRGVVARGGGAAILVGLLTAGGSTVVAADHGVGIAGFAFSPGSITISVGDSITWTNSDPASHTATADNGSFDTGAIASGASANVTFATAGTFAYHCRIHSSMTATVVVAAAGGNPTPTPTAPPPAATAAPTTAATAPPSDTAGVVAPARPAANLSVELALLAFTALGALAVARRRFGRPKR